MQDNQLDNTNELNGSVQNTTPQEPTNDQPVQPMDSGPSVSPMSSLKKPSKTLYILLVVLLLLGGAFFFLQSQQSSAPTREEQAASSDSPVIVEQDPVSQTEMIKYFSISDLNVGVPVNWEISISQKSDTYFSARFYPPNVDKTITFAEVQIAPSDEFINNPVLTVAPTETIGSLQINEGSENFLESQRSVFQVEKMVNNQKAQITFFGSADEISAFRQSIIDMLLMPEKTTGFNINFPSKVSAQETPTVGGIPVTEAKVIEIMEGPYPERITAEDYPFETGYAKLYKFDYIKGQRIEVLSEENSDDLSEIGSYIESKLYYQNPSDPNDITLLVDAGTRIGPRTGQEFETGTYYLLINTFDNKEGRILVKIFDLDQVQDLFYAKYADGSEILLNGGDIVTNNQEGIFLLRLTGPVEVINGNQFRWFRQIDNACISCNPVGGYGDVTPELSTTVNQSVVAHGVVKLFSNQVLVQPEEGGGFPLNSNIRLMLDLGEYPGSSGGPGVSSVIGYGFGTY